MMAYHRLEGFQNYGIIKKIRMTKIRGPKDMFSTAQKKVS